MAIPIDPEWSFIDAIHAANDRYTGGGLMSRTLKLDVLRNWGNVVGKKRALIEFQSFISSYSSQKEAASALGISPNTLCSMKKFYSSLPEKKFDVALSYAGEDRSYVEKVAETLSQYGIRLFYDQYEELDMWGKNLVTHLEDIFMNSASSVVIFASKNYAAKAYPRLEKEAALARAIDSNKEYILLARFDDTRIPGISPTIKYIDIQKMPPEDFALMIIGKLKILKII